jgi:D-glucosaminate-6-phosphate ammonia-lyase
MSVVDRFGLREVINVTGTMTAIGACSVATEVVEAIADVLPRFVDMDQLQGRASEVIARVTGAEAGCVSASAASGLTVAVAACMAGADLYRAEQLPDTRGLKNEVVVQRGHMVWYGASVGQLVRLAGATLVEIGDATRVGGYQLAGAIHEGTAAALFVTSHHTVQYGLIHLRDFTRIAHERGVPVIVDAASESEMHSFIDSGADLVCFSGHKFLAGPTSGIVAGRRDLVRACLLHQQSGIGRPMKVGKEGVVGVMAALERWERLDHRAVQLKEREVLATFERGLVGVPGLGVVLAPDPTGNAVVRARLKVEPAIAGLTAFELAQGLRRGDQPIIVRDHHAIDEHYLELDPCNVTCAQAELVTARIIALVGAQEADKVALRASLPHAPNAADLQERGLRRWSGAGEVERG